MVRHWGLLRNLPQENIQLDFYRHEGARLTKGKRYEEMFMTDANWTRIERLENFAKQHNHTLLELAFSWLAAQPVVACVIAGATRPEQLEANVNAADWKLTPDDLREIDRITSNATQPGD